MMTIVQAKEQVKDAVEAYLKKDEFGNYLIPLKNQRPIFINGAPGLGKTEIMEQISAELKIGLVPYSMTHHTRQSALGLPFIKKRSFGGVEYEFSEYTMSEIIAAVHKKIDDTGYKEGILFLDEVNCVSETLAPAMLCFLQYKKFGEHALPEGWVIVTAGNANQDQNKSMRDFDTVTWDRLKRIDVVPNYECWKPYAYSHGVHGAVLSFLEVKKDSCFHVMEKTVDGKQFVTARGWTDLSEMMKTYELLNKPVNSLLISQYIQHTKIAVEFANYYKLWNKYKADYKIGEILAGKSPDDTRKRVEKSSFDEQIVFIGLLNDVLFGEFRDFYREEQTAYALLGVLKKLKLELISNPGTRASKGLENQLMKYKEQFERDKKAAVLTPEEKYVRNNTVRILEDMYVKLETGGYADNASAFAVIKKDYDAFVETEVKAKAATLGERLTNALEFCHSAFTSGRGMTIFVTNLAINTYTVNFLGHYPCEAFNKYKIELLISQRGKKLRTVIDDLDLGSFS